MWKKYYSDILNYVARIYGFDYIELPTETNCTDAAVRRWLAGECFPSQNPKVIEYVKRKIQENSSQLCDQTVTSYYQLTYPSLCTLIDFKTTNNISEITGILLSMCYANGKAKKRKDITVSTKMALNPPNTTKKGRTQVIVFDFDGTIAKGKLSRTSWESIWTALGYDVAECRKLHEKFNNCEITHAEWCKLTEEKFIEKKMHRSILENIAKKIKLINGVKETFKFCHEHDIKIYIVSGSILTIIKSVLGNLYQYIDGIKANNMWFNSGGFLAEIVGTKYDFEGKAQFIREVAEELNISTQDILFVGNSVNDRFAYQSGAETLCINPKLVDITDNIVWNHNIIECKDLQEIIPFIRI